jgi:Kdo2-lipid IVA lauroyltransferase/acyltransferase
VQISTHKIEYILLLIIQFIFSFLPRFITLRIGFAIGFILYWSGAYKKTVFGNMRYTGYWSEEELKGIVRNLYRNMGRYISDFLRISAKNPPYRTHSYDIIDRLQNENKGAIILLAHLGNWEVLAQIFGSKVKDLSVIAKPMKNKIVDDWLTLKRAATKVTTIYTQQALRKMLEALNVKKALVAILIDQHAGQHGTMVPFLGKEANTVRTVAGIVKKTQCAVVPTYSILQKDGIYDVFISEAPILDLTGKSDEQAIEAYQIQHNAIISEWIRKYPDHYFGWFHKRYRGIISYK